MSKRDVVAGVLLVNAIPHAVIGLAGHRCLTPLGGEDSGPGLNLLWAAMNVAGGAALLASAPWARLTQADADRRRRSVQVGVAAMAAFGQVYELVRSRREGAREQVRAPGRR